MSAWVLAKPFSDSFCQCSRCKNLNNRWFSNLKVIFFLCSKHIWSNLELLLYELSLSNHDKTLKTKLNHDGPILLIRLSFSVNLDQQRQKCQFQLWVDLIFTLQQITCWVCIGPFWKIDFYYNSFHINIGLVLITDKDEWYADYQLLVENLGRAKPDVLVMDYQYVLERKNFVSNLRRFYTFFCGMIKRFL